MGGSYKTWRIRFPSIVILVHDQPLIQVPIIMACMKDVNSKPAVIQSGHELNVSDSCEHSLLIQQFTTAIQLIKRHNNDVIARLLVSG